MIATFHSCDASQAGSWVSLLTPCLETCQPRTVTDRVEGHTIGGNDEVT